MPKFRKKPVVIEAHQIKRIPDGKPTPSWLIEACVSGVVENRRNELYIKTLEGEMHVADGDWVIQGIKGELYPCKPDIFDATYEPVN